MTERISWPNRYSLSKSLLTILFVSNFKLLNYYLLYCFRLAMAGWQERVSPVCMQTNPVSHSLSRWQNSPSRSPYTNTQCPMSAHNTNENNLVYNRTLSDRLRDTCWQEQNRSAIASHFLDVRIKIVFFCNSNSLLKARKCLHSCNP